MPARAARGRPLPDMSRKMTLPPGVGGLDHVSAGNEMTPDRAIFKRNLIASERGDRVRLGSREWCTGLTGLADDLVRTTIPYVGTQTSKDRLFQTTSTGIYDVSSSSASPSQVIAFGTQTGDAGYGVYHAFVSLGGHYLFYVDEENGAFIYVESTDTWSQLEGSFVPWAANTAYVAGESVTNDDGKIYICDQSGTSAGSGGPTGTGTNIADNTARWDYVSPAPDFGVYVSLDDQRLGVDFDPAEFVFVTAFKGRPWFLQKNTARAWYLAAGTIMGLATKFDLATKFRQGGDAVGLWNWTYDGGAGMDDSLVCVSRGGDVVIYQGTDPASASTFGLKGVWGVGAPPAGRQIASNFGGDVLLMTRAGILPLSQLVMGGANDPTKYITAEIGPLFNSLMLERSAMKGWSIRLHPEEHALWVTVPTAESTATDQLVMSLARRPGKGPSWSVSTGLPVYSCEVWQGKMYYGTTDGKTGINDGYADGRTLADPDSYSEIAWSELTAFSDWGSPNQKQVTVIRPTFIHDGAEPAYGVEARYDWDLSSITAVGNSAATGSVWDTGEWDEATWGGEYAAARPIAGSVGMGVDVAISIAGQSSVRTILVKFDVKYLEGGFL